MLQNPQKKLKILSSDSTYVVPGPGQLLEDPVINFPQTDWNCLCCPNRQWHVANLKSVTDQISPSHQSESTIWLQYHSVRTLWTKPINILGGWKDLGWRTTLANFDLLLASEHKASSLSSDYIMISVNMIKSLRSLEGRLMLLAKL